MYQLEKMYSSPLQIYMQLYVCMYTCALLSARIHKIHIGHHLHTFTYICMYIDMPHRKPIGTPNNSI